MVLLKVLTASTGAMVCLTSCIVIEKERIVPQEAEAGTAPAPSQPSAGVGDVPVTADPRNGGQGAPAGSGPPEDHELSLPAGPAPVLATPADWAGIENIGNDDSDPIHREDIPDCGYPHRPLRIFPNKGGDTVSFGNKSTYYVYDTGDSETGPTWETHDRLVMPGLPSEPEIMLGQHSITFCYPERQSSIVIFRQMCGGDGWNNSFEAISFEDGATFVDPRIVPEGVALESYMSAKRAEQLGMYWLNDKRRGNWGVYPMPAQFLPTQESQKQCRADAKKR